MRPSVAARRDPCRASWIRWILPSLGLGAGVILMSAFATGRGGPEDEGWYRLTAIIPGQRVPNWLFKDHVYRGTPVRDGTTVMLSSPDSASTAHVSSALLVKVASPIG
jgi:hypothetical protein